MLLFCASSWAQGECHERIVQDIDYPFQYSFRLLHVEDTMTSDLTIVEGEEGSSILTLGNAGDTLVMVLLEFQNSTTGETFKAMTNFDGGAKIVLSPGKYFLLMSAYRRDTFTLEFEIKKSQQIDLEVHLGLGPDSEMYDIQSKVKLQEEEVHQIMECVRLNPRGYHEACSDPERYVILCRFRTDMMLEFGDVLSPYIFCFPKTKKRSRLTLGVN